MALDNEQKGIMRNGALAVLASCIVFVAGYLWVSPAYFGLDHLLPVGDRIAFALICDLPVFVWLAGCVRAVSSGRFREPADRKGAAFGTPTPALAIRIAVLQNSLEQTVLVVGAHLILATQLRGPELVLLPVSTFLYLCGRAMFALNYSKGAVPRSFGMALTGAQVIIGYVLATVLLIARF